MFYDPGCSGRVLLGALSPEIQERLAALPGEWLEYDPGASAIVVRHVQPSAAPCLPTITAELVAMIAAIPECFLRKVTGGDLHVHTDDARRLVRLRVGPGGAMRLQWAQPDYERTTRTSWLRGSHALVESRVQRLNGEVTLETAEPAKAARQVQRVADGFEGLYPEGEIAVRVREPRTVTVTLHDVSLDVELLAATLVRWAVPESLNGHVDVTSFAFESPEQDARFVFEHGRIWVQHPALWAAEA